MEFLNQFIKGRSSKIKVQEAKELLKTNTSRKYTQKHVKMMKAKTP